MQHETRYVEEVGAKIDVAVADLVIGITKCGARTTSSCQGVPGPFFVGNPAEYGPGRYGHVQFEKGDWEECCRFTFEFLRRVYGNIWGDVVLGVRWWEDSFKGLLQFRAEALPDVTRRIQQHLLGTAEYDDKGYQI